MKNKNDFLSYYDSVYKNILNKKFELLLEEMKKRVNKTIILLIIIDLIPSLGVFFLVKDITIKAKLLLLFAYNLFIIITTILATKRYNKEKSYKFNEKIIEDILEYIVGEDNYEYVPNNRISKSSFAKTNVFNLEKTKYNGKNYIKTKYKNNDIILGDFEIYLTEQVISTRTITKDNKMYLQTISRDKKKNIFSGSYIGATLNKPIHCPIYLIPNTIDTLFKSKLNKYIELEGNQIDLENLEINKKYKVYSDNEINARQILTLSLMEKINKLDELFKEKKYIVFKDDGRFSIMIENNDIENIKNTKLHIVNNQINIESITNIFEKINKYFMIYEILDLDN